MLRGQCTINAHNLTPTTSAEFLLSKGPSVSKPTLNSAIGDEMYDFRMIIRRGPGFCFWIFTHGHRSWNVACCDLPPIQIKPKKTKKKN